MNPANKKRILILCAVLIVVAGASIWYFGYSQNSGGAPGPVACTPEAMQCPDGSYVGRTGPNCEFAACPMASSTTAPTATVDTSNWKTYTSGEFGFSFKYPPNWHISGDVLSIASPHLFLGNPLSGTATYRVDITLENNPQNLSAADFVKQMLMDDAAQDASNSKEGPAPRITPQFDRQFPIIGTLPGSDTFWGYYELYGVFEFDHNAEQMYMQQNKQMIVVDFPVADANPNIADPAANNAIAHSIVDSIKLDANVWKFCGGIAAFQCANGYSCKLDGAYPDAGGHCVPN